jgi:hypothetical protein
MCACREHLCSNGSPNLPDSSFPNLISKHANRSSTLLFRRIWRLFHVLFLDICHTCPIPCQVLLQPTAVVSCAPLSCLCMLSAGHSSASHRLERPALRHGYRAAVCILRMIRHGICVCGPSGLQSRSACCWCFVGQVDSWLVTTWQLGAR